MSTKCFKRHWELSLSKVWNENERFSLAFIKVLVFMPKNGSLHTGTGVLISSHKSVSRFQEKEKRGEMITKNDNIK
jgi:hypothetical protein